jgi:hypothetical protein
MTDSLFLPETYIKDTDTIKGKGVYANRNYTIGDVVEVSPVIVLFAPYATLPPKLKTRVFNWGDLTQGPVSSALALGFGSMYNHSNPANVKFKANAESESITFIAEKNISINEELTINYNGPDGSSASKQDDWFDRNNITLSTSSSE